MEIRNITDKAFGSYGKVLQGYDFGELLEKLQLTPCPVDEVIYVPITVGSF